jgi:hypothetical protein
MNMNKIAVPVMIITSLLAGKAITQPRADFLGRSLGERSSYSYGEISYNTVSSRLDGWIACAADKTRTNAVFDYKNAKTGFSGEEFRQLLYRMGLFGALDREGISYRAMVETVQQLGSFVGITAITMAAKIAESRGDSPGNFYLYLDEVAFRFVDGDGSVQRTSGAPVAREIAWGFEITGVQLPGKVTQAEYEKGAREFGERKGKALEDIEAAKNSVLELRLGDGGRVFLGKLWALHDIVEGLEIGQPDAKETLAAAEMSTKGILEQAIAENEAKAKKEIPAAPPAQMGIGGLAALQFGQQLPGVSIMDAIPPIAFENGRITKKFWYLWDSYDDRYEDAGTGKTVQEGRLLADIGRNEMTRRVDYFCSQVALRIMCGNGLVEKLAASMWHLSDAGKATSTWKGLSDSQRKKITGMLENGRTYFYSDTVGGMRLIDIMHAIGNGAGAPLAGN